MFPRGDDGANADDGSGKRKDASAVTPSPKKARISTEKIIDASTLTAALLHEVKLTGKDAPWIQLRVGNLIYIVNKNTQEQTLAAGSFVTSFGKGSFQLLKKDQEPAANHHEFNLSSEADMVVFNGVMTMIGKVLFDERAKKPDASIAYHKLELNDADPKKFTLTQTHRVCFVPKDDAKEISQHNLGNKFPLTTWGTASSTMVCLWHVRWSPKGLMPVKPAVHLVGELVLPAGRACLCTS